VNGRSELANTRISGLVNEGRWVGGLDLDIAHTTSMKYNLDHITVELKEEGNGLRLTTNIENWFIPNQTVQETKKVTEVNYKMVKDHFKNKTGLLISDTDLANVCLNIVLHYFQMYNHWRRMYKKEANRDLKFIRKDFAHPYTSSHIVDYFKKMYPENYADKCEVMLDMTPDQFKEYAIRKEQFDNMW
jgi:hypothetical protein